MACSRESVRLQLPVFADPPTITEDEQLLASFHKAWHGLFDVSEIEMRIAVTPNAKTPGAAHFQIRLDPADLMLLAEGDHYVSHLAFEFAGYTTEWLKEPAAPSLLDLNITQKQRIEAATNPTLLEEDLLPGVSIRKVRVIFVDRGPHAVGSVTIPIETPI